MLSVSVVIPALNEQQNIRRAVRGAWEAMADQVIVVDGGSTDQTCDFAAAEDAIVTTGVTGRASQQNAGAAIATSDILIFQHADCWLSKAAIEQVRQRYDNDPHCCFGGFRQRIESSRRIYRWLEYGNAVRVEMFGAVYGDQGIFVRRQVFEQHGGFAHVGLMEDVILSRALRKKHGRPTLLPGPIHISDRRWQRHGVASQTLRNWALIAGYSIGVPPNRLASFYPRHDR